MTCNIDDVDEYSVEQKNEFSNKLNYIKSNFVNSKFLEKDYYSHDLEQTKKIDYKHLNKFNFEKIEKDEEKLYWFGAYDKLMSNKNLKKILNFYIENENNSMKKTQIVKIIHIK
jgi:hypothetical protein